MKVYLAAPYAARAQVRQYAHRLNTLGIEVTSSWLKEEHEINAGTVAAANALADADAARHALGDFEDIERSDLLVVLTEAEAELHGGTGSSGGRHVETGYALGRGKPVLVVGEPENVFHRLGEPWCTVVTDWPAAVDWLHTRLCEVCS